MHLLASPHALVLGFTGVQNAGKKLATQRISMSSTCSTPKHGANGALLTQDRKISRECIHGIPCNMYSTVVCISCCATWGFRAPDHPIMSPRLYLVHLTTPAIAVSSRPFPSHSYIKASLLLPFLGVQLSPSLRAVLVRRSKNSKPLGSYLPAADITSPFE